jgi:assimilatory nitrate reductase catalytic subunit
MNIPAPFPTVRTTCPYCGVGCGIGASADGRGGASISGDTSHPANYGVLCSKGSSLGETLGLDTRLLFPMVSGTRASWDIALDHVASGVSRIIEKHGPDAVAFYLSGQLLNEDYYVANKLMKGFIGSANVDTNSRLCMASSVAGHRLVLGSDTVPGCYEDIDSAEVLVLVGSNAAWCHPVLYRRMIEAREGRGARIVTIDVRGTATSEGADLALTIRPGMDAVLFCGLLVHLARSGAIDRDYVSAHTEGFEAALEQARSIAPDVNTVATKCGTNAADVGAFFELWGATPRVVTLYSQGVNQSWQGTDKVASILACHLASGRIGNVGAGPFSLTGQPNAMGGREVGGLANQLAAHMGFAPAERDRVRRFWRAPRVAEHEGLDAVSMFDAIARGEIRALWVMGTNPAVSMPRADHVRAALTRLELLVVSDNVRATDTIASGAHVLLPAAAWGEKDGTITNSERRISRQRAFLPRAGQAMPDWWAVSEVARRLGFEGSFAYTGPAAIFREHAALSSFENDGSRDFDLGGLAEISDADYDALDPIQWPVRFGTPRGRARIFADGRFFTPSGRARFKVIAEPGLPAATCDRFPVVLNTGRIRDQWHTMMRTGLSPRLGGHAPEPFVEVSPEDARQFGLTDGGFARVTTAHGSVVLRVVATTLQTAGRVFAPIHWSDETAGGARIGALVHSIADSESKQPDLKSVPAALEPVSYKAQGFVIARRRSRLPGDTIWAWRAVDGGFVAAIATNEDFRCLFEAVSAEAPLAEKVTYDDSAQGMYRGALISDGRLDGALVVAPAGVDNLSRWCSLVPALRENVLDNVTRRFLLSGHSVTTDIDTSPTICACFSVTSRAIAAVIAEGAVTSESIGMRLSAGTNCGSCVPEMRRMISAHASACGRVPAALRTEAGMVQTVAQ